jgi:eukaryotic-like serine/threonine-protein kinase
MSGGPTSQRSLPFPPGTVLAGKYRVEKLLGEGGMGWVVEAMHIHLEQRVALKFMHARNMVENPDAVARFLREARAAARIQSEHIARVFDVGTLDSGEPYLVMEYLEGQDLEGLLRAKGTLPVEQVVEYALQACEGLAEAHAKGIVHRDLKPANLFLARRTDGSVRVKLLDFGISKLAPQGGGSDVGMTSTQALMGSPLYMSPEQLRSSKNVDRRADLWSMGVILYEMLGGEAPFQADTLPEVCARIMAEPPPPLAMGSKGIGAVVMRCLEKDPSNRFADAGALAAALAPMGSADSRAIAERISRVVRSSGASLPEIRTDASGPLAPMTAAAASGIVQTSAQFGTVTNTKASRRSTLPLVIGAGAALAIAVGIGVLAMRGKHAEVAPIVAAPAEPPAAISAPPVLVAPSASVAAAPSAAPSSSPTDTVASSAPAPSATPAPAVAQGRPQPRTRPTSAGTANGTPAVPPPAPAPTPTAKPASTNGFGGRD